MDLFQAYQRGYITDQRYTAITTKDRTTMPDRRPVVNVPTAERHPLWRAAIEDGWIGMYNDQVQYEEERQYFLREVVTDAIQKETAAAGVGLASIHPVSVRTMMETPPPPLDFVVGSFLAGTVGILTAPGATGKSFFVMELAIDIATGADILGLRPKIGGVTYLVLEDAMPVLEHRVHDIGQYVAQEYRDRLDNLQVLAGVGTRVDVEAEADWFIEHCAGQRLIIVDTLSRAHSYEENSNTEMSRLLVTLDRIAVKSGAAVLLLHHVAKHADGADQHAARGASAITDNARWAGFVETLGEKQVGRYRSEGQPIDPAKAWQYLRFNESKVNHGPSRGDHWYKREADTGVLLPVDMERIPIEKRVNKRAWLKKRLVIKTPADDTVITGKWGVEF